MSDGTYLKKTITVDAALAMVSAAVQKAKELGLKQVIAVCDDGGNLKAFARMDGASMLSIQVAQDKAYTAAGFGVATDKWYGLIKDDPGLLAGAPSQIKRLIIFGGGYPIKTGAEVIGGIGVSGASAEQDMEVAKAGLEVFKGD
jgi:uncharacterized protein GlcG (DUF336 family)